MKRLLLLLPLLLTPAAAYANEIRLSCRGELDYSAIKGKQGTVEPFTEALREGGFTFTSHEIVINKESKVALITEVDKDKELHKKVPFFETPTAYLIEIKDRSDPTLDQIKQHQVDRTDASYTYIWEVKTSADGELFWRVPFFGKCTKQKRVKTLF